MERYASIQTVLHVMCMLFFSFKLEHLQPITDVNSHASVLRCHSYEKMQLKRAKVLQCYAAQFEITLLLNF